MNGYKGWRSPALPEFDPFWRDVEDAGLPIVLHASQPPLQEYIDKWEPPSTSSAFEMSAFKWTALGHREIADMLTSLICHGTLTRFPKLRIASVENGSAWIKPLFDDLQSTYNKMPQNFPDIHTRSFAATSGSARSGRAQWPTSCKPSDGTR